MTVAHCTPFDSAEEAARDILSYPYDDADAYVAEADTSKDASNAFHEGLPKRAFEVSWIGKTRRHASMGSSDRRPPSQ